MRTIVATGHHDSSLRLRVKSDRKGYHERTVSTDDNWFGPRLKALRRQADLTQQALADQLGVGQQTVREWERGDKRPHLERIPRLASALGVEPGDLFPPIAPPPAADRLEDTLPPEASVEARLARIERQLRRVLEDLQELKGR